MRVILLASLLNLRGRMRSTAVALIAAAVLACAAPVAAQDADADAKKPPTPEHTGVHALFRNLGEDYKNLGHLDNLVAAALGGAGALAVHPWDADINAHLRSHYTLVNDIYAPAKYYGDTPIQVGLSVGTFVFGRIFDEPKASHLG